MACPPPSPGDKIWNRWYPPTEGAYQGPGGNSLEKARARYYPPEVPGQPGCLRIDYRHRPFRFEEPLDLIRLIIWAHGVVRRVDDKPPLVVQFDNLETNQLVSVHVAVEDNPDFVDDPRHHDPPFGNPGVSVEVTTGGGTYSVTSRLKTVPRK